MIDRGFTRTLGIVHEVCCLRNKVPVRERILALDTLRGLGAISVAFFYHYQHFGGDPFFFSFPIFSQLKNYGDLGVDLFFLLSGFIFAHTYLEPISKGTVLGQEFFVLRVSRLAPLHYLTALITGILAWGYFLSFGKWALYASNDAYHLVLNFLFIHYIGIQQAFSFNAPSWSLSQEVFCYVLFFVVARHAPRYFAVLCLAFVVLGLYLVIKNPTGILFFSHSTGRALAGFFGGCLLSLVSAPAVRPFAMRIAMIALSYFIVTVMLNRNSGFAWGFEHNPLTVMSLTVLFPGVILLALHWSPMRRLLSLPALTYLGEISYSIYLVHIPVQMAVMLIFGWAQLPIPATSTAFWGTYCVAVVGLGALTYKRFEVPMQKQIRAHWRAHSNIQNSRSLKPE